MNAKNEFAKTTDGANQGAKKPGGDAMVTTPPEATKTAPPITAPVSLGAITTSADDDGRTAGERAADENAAAAAEKGEAVLHDDEGKPIDVHDDVEGKAAKLESRDERHDSIDRHTGALDEDATALRAERGISAPGYQADGTTGEKPAK